MGGDDISGRYQNVASRVLASYSETELLGFSVIGLDVNVTFGDLALGVEESSGDLHLVFDVE